MIFFPSESFISGLLLLALFFFIIHHIYTLRIWPDSDRSRMKHLLRQLETNRWLGWLFLAAALAFGISASLIDLAGYPLE